MELIGLEWRWCALENERRLDLSACNYLDYAAGLAAGKAVRTDDPLCVKLRKRK